MNVEETVQNWSHSQRIQVLDLVLPGIEGFLRDVLQQESLSDEGEKLRRFYVKILENSSGPTDTDITETFGIHKNDLSPLKTPPIKVSRFSYNSEGTSDDKVLYQQDYPKESRASKEPETNVPRQDRKRTDSTEESGVFLNTPFVSSGNQEVVNPRHSDTFESISSRDTFLSDSDLELLEWENESIVNEDGYCTEDNLDNTVQNMQIQPNEFGEIYSGILYIREQPGWHKRWITITERCMKCYKYRTDDKMLFEIPLRDGKFISTDRKTSRMFPMTLSIARLKDNITFATTDEKTRQEWIYVINHVIKKLAEDPYPESPSPNPFDIKNAPFRSLLRGESVEGRVESSSLEKFPEHSKTNIAESQSESLKRKTWHAGGEKGFDDVMKQWRVRGEDETADMELSAAPSLAQEESFKELQECLPDILQRPKSKSWRGDLGNIHLTTSKKDLTGTKTQNRKTITFSADVENKQSSNPDLTNVPRVKRHGSLANSLTNKANRVRSKLTTSLFKKGKKDEKAYQQGSSKDFKFSGYLERKKGHTWKNRWCVVKNHTLFCYKEFGAPLAELELTLMGCGVKTLPEGEGGKPCMFVLSADKDQLCFAAENDAELEEWLAVLEHEARGAEKEDDEINIYPTDSIDGAMLTTLSSPDSPPEPHKSFQPKTQPLTPEEDPKPVTKRAHSFTTRTSQDKLEIQGPVKRSSLLGALANKLGRQSSRSKDVTDAKLDAVIKRELQPNDRENLVIPDSQTQTEVAQSVTENGPEMEGSLYYRPVDTWLKSKVKLQNHSLDIEPQDDFTGSIKPFETLKFRLVNCIVLDCTDTEGPLVMVVKRAIGQPLYLQADTEEDYNAWKDAISSAVLTTPSLTDRLMSSESGGEGEETLRSSKISGDSFDKDDVFFKDVTGQENLVNLSPQPHPSPRPSIAGDVSSESSVDDNHSKSRIQIKRAYSAGGIDRLRSLSEGYLVHSKKRQSPLRRTISNALTILDLSPTKRRRKTFGGLGVNASLLIGIKYTSCLYFRINKGPWTKPWCVLQQNNLHFFKNSEEISPISSMKLEGCVVVKTRFKGKKFAFVMKLPSDKTEYCFAAHNERELDIWVELLQAEGDVQRRSEKPLATFDLLNGVLPRVKSEGNINIASKPDVAAVDDTKGNTTNNTTLKKMTSKSLVELRKIREAGDAKQLFKDSNGNSVSSSSAITHKPTSLQEVLLLLQEQQLMQSMGHQRYIRVKKARGNWRKSAAAVLKDTNSQPESPEFPKKQPATKEKKEKIETVPQGKPRGASTGSISSVDYTDVLSSCQTSEDYLGKCEKLAEEEKLKALKTETLLRKRRNSLTLEKDVLQKKLEKTQEKKGTVKKFLGKDVVKNQEEIIRDQKRLKEINLKLAHVDQDMRENKHKEAAVMENITALKSNPRPRRFSENYESVKSLTDTTITTRSIYDERRAKSRESPTGSISSRDSFDDKNEPYRPSVPERAASLNRKGSKKTGQASLLALEEELQKISPNVTRRKKYASGKRVSSSSEGSFDESILKESPGSSQRDSTPPEEKRESISSIGSLDSQTKAYGWDNLELKKTRHSGSFPTLSKIELHSVAVNIPTPSGADDTDSPPVSSEHRPSLITALSQIKDFEEFLEIHKLR